jgi:hypothetical protein
MTKQLSSGSQRSLLDENARLKEENVNLKNYALRCDQVIKNKDNEIKDLNAKRKQHIAQETIEEGISYEEYMSEFDRILELSCETDDVSSVRHLMREFNDINL